ncbi:MAG: hypothetical protein HQL48_00145 [Gammaproteobacteria bacterium]|nr:hypothetical protein [Gammaproteobacteria bacterium]
MDMWMKIGSALLLVMMLVYLWPRAKLMMKESPKGSMEDWKSAVLALVGVIGFVILLMTMV